MESDYKVYLVNINKDLNEQPILLKVLFKDNETTCNLCACNDVKCKNCIFYDNINIPIDIYQLNKEDRIYDESYLPMYNMGINRENIVALTSNKYDTLYCNEVLCTEDCDNCRIHDENLLILDLTILNPINSNNKENVRDMSLESTKVVENQLPPIEEHYNDKLFKLLTFMGYDKIDEYNYISTINSKEFSRLWIDEDDSNICVIILRVKDKVFLKKCSKNKKVDALYSIIRTAFNF